MIDVRPPFHPLRHLNQAFGGPAGATSIEFSLNGQSWKWGGYRLDALVASGTADSSEGVALEELSLTSGPARLLARGSLLSPRQEAELHVTDFPLDLLQVDVGSRTREARSRSRSTPIWGWNGDLMYVSSRRMTFPSCALEAL